MIFDEDKVFLSSVVQYMHYSYVNIIMQYIYKRLDINLKTINPDNHGPLTTERHIKTNEGMLTKHHTGTEQTCRYTYHACDTGPAHGWVSLFQLTFGSHPGVLIQIENKPQECRTDTLKEYYVLLRKKIANFQTIVEDYSL